MAEFHSLEPQAESNQAAVPNGLPRGTPGGFVYGVIRELQAACRRFHDDTCGRLVSTGSNGSYSVATGRSLDLARGAALSFRANHSNPNAGPSLLGRPLTFADGSQIPAGWIKANQLIEARYDPSANRWTMPAMPVETAATPTITGDKLSLTGQVAGSSPYYTAGGWVATAAGTATQILHGGPNPSFKTPAGIARMLCTIGPDTTITNTAGLAHTAAVSRLSEGRYRITPTPVFPNAAYRVLLQPGHDSGDPRIAVLDMTEKLASSFVIKHYNISTSAVFDIRYMDVAVFY